MREQEDFTKYNFENTEGPIARELLSYLEISKNDRIFDPCAGTCTLSDAIRAEGHRVWSNDILPCSPADTHADATSQHWWATRIPFNWVISNPPFDLAHVIIPLAYNHASKGIAMTLRLSWLEPTKDRRDFLKAHPPSQIVVLNPRPQYKRGKNGKFSTDSVTTAWFIWYKQYVQVDYPFVFSTDRK